MVITPDDIPILPPFDSKPYDVKVTLDDGTVEIVKVQARGPCVAMMTAMYTVGRWSPEKISKLVSINL